MGVSKRELIANVGFSARKLGAIDGSLEEVDVSGSLEFAGLGMESNTLIIGRIDDELLLVGKDLYIASSETVGIESPLEILGGDAILIFIDAEY